MEGLLIWLGAKALVVAGLAALFVPVHLFGAAVLRRLPDGPLKRVLGAREQAAGAPADYWSWREWTWAAALYGGAALLIWAVYAYNTAY